MPKDVGMLSRYGDFSLQGISFYLDNPDSLEYKVSIGLTS